MKKKKVLHIVLLIALALVDGLVANALPTRGFWTNSSIRALSWTGVLTFLIIAWQTKSLTGELCSPYFVTFSVAYMFCMGQTFGWALGLDMGDVDLLQYDFKMGIDMVGNSLVYTLLGLVVFHIGAVCAYKPKAGHVAVTTADIQRNQIDFRSFRTAGIVLLVISLPSFLINSVFTVKRVAMGGYAEYYNLSDSYTQLERMLLYPEGWFPISLLFLYVTMHEKKIFRNLILVGIFLDILVILYVGGRSAAVLIVLAFVIARHYLIKPLEKKETAAMLGVSYVGICVLNTIKEIRLESGHSILDYLGGLGTSAIHAIGSFIGELGWNQSSLAWTMMLTPTAHPFRWGQSYGYALTAAIPNLGFWKVHPAATYADLGDWMQELLGRTTGLGYTFVAESYANYSWFGLAVLFVLGLGIGALFCPVNRSNARNNYRRTFFIIMLITTILKSFVRSSFSAIMRSLVFTVILTDLLVAMLSRWEMRRKSGRVVLLK